MEPNDWGLTFELRDAQVAALDGHAQLAAHVRPLRRAAARSSGSIPTRALACGVLTDRAFGDWAKEAWPPFSDAVLAEL